MNKYLSAIILCLLSKFFNVVGESSKCPEIITRTRWGGRIPLEVDYSLIPIEYVIVHHTVTPTCSNEKTCSEMIKSIQNFHMENLEFHDIGYNFLIGGDGKVYEGVGWHKVGAHTYGYNTRSLGVALIGDFTETLPTSEQLQATKDLLACGVELGELDARYKLLGGRQVGSTLSPGLKLYREISKWPNFAKAP